MQTRARIPTLPTITMLTVVLWTIVAFLQLPTGTSAARSTSFDGVNVKYGFNTKSDFTDHQPPPRHLSAQQPNVMPQARTFRQLNAITNGSTVYILYVSNDHSTESYAIADSRQRFATAGIAGTNITIISTLVLYSQVPNSTMLYRAVPNASLLVHVSVASGLFNQSIPFVAANVSFCFLLSTTLPQAVTDLDNVVQSAMPDTNMGMEAGMLAGLVTKSNVVAMWYDVARQNAVNGVRAGMLLVCPLCTLKAYALCSGGLLCPGEIQQAFTWSYLADVIITAYTFSNVLPNIIFALNANESTTVSGGVITAKWRRVILMGNRLGDLTTNTTSHSDFLGAVSLVQGSLSESISQTILGTFDGSARTVRYYWSNNLRSKIYVPPNTTGSSSTGSSVGGSSVFSGSGSSSSGNLPYLTNTLYTEFVFRRQSFEVGAVVPTYDVIALAQADDTIVGGPPFIPFGHTVTGLDLVSDGAGSSYRVIPAAVTVQAAFCVQGATTVLISADLTTAVVFHVTLGQFVTVLLNTFTDADFATAANMSATSGSAELLRASWYQDTPQRRPTLPATPRTGMDCNVMDDAFILSGGYVLTENFTWTNATPSTDVLRLIPMCSTRAAVNNFSTIPNCDVYMLQNVTDMFQDSPHLARATWDQTPRSGGVAMAVGGVKVAAATTTNATIRQLIASSRVFLPNYVLPYVSTQAEFAIGSVVNATTFETIATFRIYPPTAAGSTGTLAAKNFIPIVKTYVAALSGFIAFDAVRRNVVLLSSTRIDFVVRSALSGSSTTSTSTFARWQDATVAIPTAVTPLCIFYNAAASRYGVLVTATGSNAPLVYHYSSTQRTWYLQATYDTSATPNEQYGCVALNEVAGGAALIVPITTWRLTSMSIVYYPAAVPTCSAASGLVLAVSQRTCTRCTGTQVATSDGFCVPSVTTDNRLLENWMIALIVVVAGCLVITCVIVGIRKCRRYLDPRRLARLPKHAPPTGNCACLFVGISDADVMWAGDINELSFRADEPLSVSGAQEQLEEMRELMDDFNDIMCRSVAANRCYLMSFRGDTAVVIGATPADVLCVAVELTSAFAAQDPPVRLSCGLHMAQLIQERVAKFATKKQIKKQMESSGTGSTSSSGSSDVGKPKFHYAGQGLHIATKLSGVSKKGRLMASHVFLDEINSHLMKHLGVVRGDTISIQVESTSVIDARELVVQRYSDAFDAATSLDEARARRKRWLKERKQQLHAKVVTKRKDELSVSKGTPGISNVSSGFQYKHRAQLGAGGMSTSPPVDNEATSSNPPALLGPPPVDAFTKNPFSQQPILATSSGGNRGNSFKFPTEQQGAPLGSQPTRHNSGKDLQVSFTAGTSLESKVPGLQVARASPASTVSLSPMQEEMLQQLAQALCRLLLTNLPGIGQRGMECMHILSAKLHLPSVTSGSGHKRGVVPATVVRACAQRLMLLALEDLKQIVFQIPGSSAMENSLAVRPTKRSGPRGSSGAGASNSIEAGMLTSMLGFGESPKMRLSGIFSLERPNSATAMSQRADDEVDEALKEPGRAQPHSAPHTEDRDERFSPQSGADDGDGTRDDDASPHLNGLLVPELASTGGASNGRKYSSSAAGTLPFGTAAPTAQDSPRSGSRGPTVIASVQGAEDEFEIEVPRGDEVSPTMTTNVEGEPPAYESL